MWTPPATRVFSLSNSGRRVKRFRVSSLSARRVYDCRRPAWRCADRIHIAFARSEAPRKPAGFSDPVSTAGRPCIVLGLSRVSGDADLRFDSSKSRTPEELLIHFLIRSHGPGPINSPHITSVIISCSLMVRFRCIRGTKIVHATRNLRIPRSGCRFDRWNPALRPLIRGLSGSAELSAHRYRI